MKRKYLKAKIKELGPWYQRVSLDGIFTTRLMLTGEHVWPYIRSVLPDDIQGAKILDIGANACYYSYMLALEGAEVIAVEPDKQYIKQALFLKEFLENQYEKELNVKLIRSSISNIDFEDYEYFDFVLALSVIYFIGRHFGGKYSDGALLEQKRIIKELTQVTDKIVVRTRDKIPLNSVAYYTSLFLENDFYLLKKIEMKRPIVLYGRLIKHGDYRLGD